MVDFTGESEAFLDLTEEEVGGKKIEQIKPGEYVAKISEASVKNTKAGGKYIQLKWTILEGDYARRSIVDFINTHNANPQAQQIGRERLKGILVAGGRDPVIKTMKDLVDIKAIIGTGIENDQKGNPRAVIKFYDKAPYEVL